MIILELPVIRIQKGVQFHFKSFRQTKRLLRTLTLYHQAKDRVRSGSEPLITSNLKFTHQSLLMRE
ncbi:hypothetical protein OSB04_032193 [Centaurea solstitialis]|uniref:Uncharacterized protein n=1 Tax=Centaurea solstitialis TaxID=347529 RepID=A0AA38SB23_9ASTR|nr:hypothetical protein OSB04_032193 [Centaurea solstitialis]